MLIEMQRLSVAQMLAVYNFHSPRKAVRFESHAAGARRLRALLEKVDVTLEDACHATFPADAANALVDAANALVDAARAGTAAEEAAVAMAALHGARPGPKTEAPEAAKAESVKAPVAAAPGALPTPPDFTANTHKPYRAKLARLIELAGAGDVAGLEAIEIKPTSSSPKALIRYRDKVLAAIRDAA